jgi:hypothetical protein
MNHIGGQSESAKSNGHMMSHVYSIYPASSASASARFPRLEKHRGSTDFPLIWDLTHNIQFSNWSIGMLGGVLLGRCSLVM